MWGSSSAGAISKNSTEWPQIDTQCYVHRADPDGILASSERSARLRRKYLCGVANTSIWWRTSVRQHGVVLARANILPVRMDSQKALSALRTQPRGGTGDVAAPHSSGGTLPDRCDAGQTGRGIGRLFLFGLLFFRRLNPMFYERI